MDSRWKALLEVVLVYILLIMIVRLLVSFSAGEWINYLILLLAIIILVYLAVRGRISSGKSNTSRDGGNSFVAIAKYTISIFFIILSGLWSALVLVWLAVTRRDVASYGITLRHLRGDLTVVAICVIPMLMILFSTRLFQFGTPVGTIIFSALEILMLIVLAIILTRVPRKEEKETIIDSRILIPAGVIGSILVMLYMIQPSMPFLPKFAQIPLQALIFAFVMQAIPQEILFRGYMQSRLNEAFGCPYRFFGVDWGMGLIISSLLFGLMHVLNGFNPFTGDYQFILIWGVWTFFSGLFYGFLREKTGDITAPTILHGIWDVYSFF